MELDYQDIRRGGACVRKGIKQSALRCGIVFLVHSSSRGKYAETAVLTAVVSAGSFNDLATAYMAFPDRTISHLFSLGSLTPQVLRVGSILVSKGFTAHLLYQCADGLQRHMLISTAWSLCMSQLCVVVAPETLQLLSLAPDALSSGLQFEVCQGDNCYFTLRSLIILCPTYLLFMVLNGGLSTPGGLFMPSIMVRCNSAPCTLSQAVALLA